MLKVLKHLHNPNICYTFASPNQTRRIMKKFIKKHQLITFAVVLTCILAITNFAFGYPKSGWGIAAPIICAAIIEGVACVIAYCYYLKHKEEIHKQVEEEAIKEMLQGALQSASKKIKEGKNNG